MIKVKLATQENDVRDQEIEIIEGETLKDAISRVLSECNIPEESREKSSKYFVCAVNAKVVDQDFWPFVQLKKDDIVLIAPKLGDGDSNQMLGQVLTVAAIAVAAYYTGPLLAQGGWLGVGGGLINAGVAIVASYLSSQLFPPPVVSNDNAGEYGDSQMFSITSQSNQVKKFGNVPRVYGTHRMFPYVAANPYTDLETDPTSGKLVQYLYCVYDFGLGPNIISDIKIGDTPIENFNDVEYRLVDFNKPAVSEGPWDDNLQNALTFYKGDLNSETLSININGNQINGDDPSTYQFERTAQENPNASVQEISLNFVAPQGLFALNSKGDIFQRAIDLDIYFAPVSGGPWVAYNDPLYVRSFKAAGGDTSSGSTTINLGSAPDLDAGGNFNDDIPLGIRVIRNDAWSISTMKDGLPLTSTKLLDAGYYGGDQLEVLKGHGLLVGDEVVHFASHLGYVTAVVSMGPTKDLIVFDINRSRTRIPLFRYKVTRWEQDDPATGHFANDYEVEKIPITSTGGLKRNNSILGRLRIAATTREPSYASVSFSPFTTEQIKVKVVRNRSTSNATSFISDNLSATAINTRRDSNPIVTDKRHTFLEMRIKASGQLNGAIQNLNATVTSVLDTYNGTSWVKAPTNNPAWIYADILTGNVTKRPIDKSRVHTASLLEWANYCDEIPTSGTLYDYIEKRFTCNFVLDFSTTAQQLLNRVANAANASFNLIDGKYGVLLDVQRTIPVQIFTPRNSSDFSSSRAYTSRPHALKVSFVDPNADWQQNEIIVYDDGYTSETATEFEDLQSFACTSVEQAFRFGRYFLAQNKLRQETITLKVDFEYLVCTRGDFVQIAHDVMKVGGTAARVKTVVGNRITIDEGIESLPVSYGYVYRNSSTGLISTDTLTIVSSDTFDLDGDMPSVGDLIIIGEVTKIVYDCIVKSITPNDDLSATLQLVEKADAIYTIESIDTIPDYDPQLSSTVDGNFQAPPEVQNLQLTANSYNILTSGYEYFTDIDWEPSLGVAYELFEVYLDTGNGFDLLTSTKSTDYRYIVNEEDLGLLHTFKVLAVSATGKKLSLGEVGSVAGTPLRKSTAPSDVLVFNSDITNETLQLFWTKVTDLDISEYIIRFNPSLSGSWESSTILMRSSGNNSLITTQARTGTYLIKAVDFNGNESSNAAVIITTIPQLTGLNVISTQNDFPALIGSKDRVVELDGTLILAEQVSGPVGSEQYYSEGFYYYEDLLDLGEIYTVRIQSLLKASGFTTSDLMTNWPTLSSVSALYTPTSSQWDVEAQYRGRNTLNVMSDWTTLSSINVLSQGNEDAWTPWRKFIIGDVTARVIQFRLRLVSNALNVSPRVLDGEIKSDMPDRVEAYSDLVAPTGGLEVIYSPAFKNNPSVAISLENGQSGDRWEYVYRDATGFKVVFYNNLNNAVSRQFDAQVRGYGRKATATI